MNFLFTEFIYSYTKITYIKGIFKNILIIKLKDLSYNCEFVVLKPFGTGIHHLLTSQRPISKPQIKPTEFSIS